jgi:excisionase family DNA binding protein
MARLFYSTGQVARQLGTTQAAVRLLCENRVIPAETTSGGQWRVPAAEVERLEREGLPPIPRPLPAENSLTAGNGRAGRRVHSRFPAESSGKVVIAADQVAITRSTLETRKIEREIEENEDWFRDRQRRQATEEALGRQQTEAKEAEQRRARWVQQWTQYGFNSMPYDARREAEMEVHVTVQEVLAVLDPSHSEATMVRLVDAAVHKALGPWTRKYDTERALKAGLDRLPPEVRYRAEHAGLKQRAWEAAVAAVSKVRDGASYNERETAALQAVQPMVREYSHQEACNRVVGRVHICDATPEEQEEAKEVVRRALAALPIGAEPQQLTRAQEAALVPLKAAVAKREKATLLESKRQAQRRAAASKADLQLGHIARYLDREYEYDGGYLEMQREADRLRPLIREALIDELVENPDMSPDEIRESIEDQLDDCAFER